MNDVYHVSAGCFAVAVCAAAVGFASASGQEAEIRAALGQTAAAIEHTDTGWLLRYPVRLAFAADTIELLPAGKAMLDILVNSLRRHKRTQIVVAVYSDAIGSLESNQQQTQARAAAIAAYLQSRQIAAPRLIARGAGESAPLSTQSTPEGRELNRRLELTISPLSS